VPGGGTLTVEAHSAVVLQALPADEA
jgi:hypothetical protein